jgi:hypothetical protein
VYLQIKRRLRRLRRFCVASKLVLRFVLKNFARGRAQKGEHNDHGKWNAVGEVSRCRRESESGSLGSEGQRNSGVCEIRAAIHASARAAFGSGVEADWSKSVNSPQEIRFLVCLAGSTRIKGVRNSKRLATMYVTAVSRDDHGCGAVKKIQWSPDRAKAFRFAKFSALEIAKHLCGPSWGRIAHVESEVGEIVEPLPLTQQEIAAREKQKEATRQLKNDIKNILGDFRNSMRRLR